MHKTRHLFALIIALAVATLGVAEPRTVVVEAEDAVSTDFAPDSVLLYGTGQNRTLQLNQRQQVSDGAFYVDLVFFAGESGEYDFWYGGSLPGSRDTLSPSYGSPFSFQVNGSEFTAVYWEDVRWGDFYSVPYSWVNVGTIALEEGVNRIRIEVSEKRRYDASFFLYLDRLVLVPVNAPDQPEYLPAKTSLHSGPESIEDMLIRIREDSQDVEAYLRVAEFYTLLGDNINAIRYLNRVNVLDAGNPRTLLLQARNNLWRGDINAALGSYWELVGAAPDRLSSFLEAGKLAAWSGFYAASEQYYLAALENHPGNVEVLANLGFTFLWWNQEPRAREYFRQAEETAQSPEAAVYLGDVYERNDDIGRAIAFYRQRLEIYPSDANLYLALVSALYKDGQEEEANGMVQRAPATLPDYPAVAARFEEVSRTYAIRKDVIAQYEASVQEDPFDLPRRRILAQTYFWIGRRDEGIRETENILTIETQQALRRFVESEQELLWMLTIASVVENTVRESVRDLSDLSDQISTTKRAYERERDKEGGDPGAIGTLLAQLVETAEADRRLAADLLTMYERVIGGSLEIVQNENVPLVEEMDSIRASLGWEPPVAQMGIELARASANGLPGVAALDQSIRTLRSDIFDWTGVLTTHPAEEAVRVVATATAGTPPDVFALIDGMESDFADPSLVYQELVFLRDTYGSEIESLWARRYPGADAAESDGIAEPFMTAETAYDRADSTVTETNDAIRDASTRFRPIPEAATTLAGIINLKADRALFALQNDTAALRNRLGAYYLDQNETELAVQQFATVLAVEPGNLEARYSLANAFRQLGKWRQAQDEFAVIYSIDPNYRNTVRVHNEIARQYADVFTAGVTVLNEESRQEARTDLGYLWQIKSNLGLRAGLSYAQYRLQVNVGEMRRHAYQDADIRLGVPFKLFRERVNIEPYAAAYVVGNQLFTVSPVGAPPDVVSDAGDYFQSYRFTPGGGARITASRGALFLLGEYGFGPYRSADDVPPVTAQIERPEASAHTMKGSFNASLAGTQNPVISRFDFRAGGEADLIQEDTTPVGLRYFLSQETSARIIDRAQPFTRVESSASVSYESYDGEESPWFYEPDSIFQAGGAAAFRLYRPAGNRHSWGISTRLYAGLYQTQAFSSKAANGLRVNGDVLAELTRDNVAFQVSVDYNASTTQFDSLDYYALTVGLQTVVRNFRLLAQ